MNHEVEASFGPARGSTERGGAEDLRRMPECAFDDFAAEIGQSALVADIATPKIRFLVVHEARGFVATAEAHPITVSAQTFRTLRLRVTAEVERQLGSERPVALLLGGPRLSPRRT
jgi:hypothetical protein